MTLIGCRYILQHTHSYEGLRCRNSVFQSSICIGKHGYIRPYARHDSYPCHILLNCIYQLFKHANHYVKLQPSLWINDRLQRFRAVSIYNIKLNAIEKKNHSFSRSKLSCSCLISLKSKLCLGLGNLFVVRWPWYLSVVPKYMLASVYTRTPY